MKFRPAFAATTLYSTQVDVLKHHFSGLLLFKPMEDGSIRVVFTNEMGMKFFDFAFEKNGGFTKHYVMPKMDKKAVVKTLKKDFEMILMRQDLSLASVFTDSTYRYTAFDLPKGKVYYITNKQCDSLVRIENASKRKPVVTVIMKGDSIDIQHHTFKFKISSQRLQQ